MHTSVLVADDGDIYDLLDRFAAYDGEFRTEEARWDYMGIGGVFAGALPLTRRRSLRRWIPFAPRLLTGASVARKFEVDNEALLAEPPMALFFRGRLHECPLSEEVHEVAEWRAMFRQLFADVPENAMLRIVDAHG